MSRSKKDGKRGGAHRRVLDREYSKSRLATKGEPAGAWTKLLTHRLERRRAQEALRASGASPETAAE